MKRFLNYEEQVWKLNHDKGVECKGKISREFLIRNGYFNLVNGYKDLFCRRVNGKRAYYENIKVDEFKYVMDFDNHIRQSIFRFVTQVEEEIGAIFGYVFEKEITALGKKWNDLTLYRKLTNSKTTPKELLSRIFHDLSKKGNDYIDHYEKTHGYFPTWVMIKALNFGTMIQLIRHTEDKFKKQLCDLYGIDYENHNYKKLSAMLSLINALRNTVAHSERVFDFHGNAKRTLTKYHRNFNYRTDHKERLIDVILYLKFFIPGKEYKVLINEIKHEFNQLKGRIHNNAFIKLMGEMGLKTSLNHVDALNELKSQSNNIVYSQIV